MRLVRALRRFMVHPPCPLVTPALVSRARSTVVVDAKFAKGCRPRTCRTPVKQGTPSHDREDDLDTGQELRPYQETAEGLQTDRQWKRERWEERKASHMCAPCHACQTRAAHKTRSKRIIAAPSAHVNVHVTLGCAPRCLRLASGRTQRCPLPGVRSDRWRGGPACPHWPAPAYAER